MSEGPRHWLLAANSGCWQGWFIRCGSNGLEQERFPTSLLVQDDAGTIEAALTYGHTGEVRRMRFPEPPAEMQVLPSGHWSLGPERIGPWPWTAELCLVHGERRRRVVFRHGSDMLETFVLVVEARPSRQEPPPPPPLQAQLLAPGQWRIGADLELHTRSSRSFADPVSCVLIWSPEPGVCLRLERRYAASGVLEPLVPAAQGP